MTELDKAAETLADKIRMIASTAPLLRKMDTAEFLRMRGFDISTLAGCKGALMWLETAKVEDAFWDEGRIENIADWYIGEARLDAMRKVLEERIKELSL